MTTTRAEHYALAEKRVGQAVQAVLEARHRAGPGGVLNLEEPHLWLRAAEIHAHLACVPPEVVLEADRVTGVADDLMALANALDDEPTPKPGPHLHALPKEI